MLEQIRKLPPDIRREVNKVLEETWRTCDNERVKDIQAALNRYELRKLEELLNPLQKGEEH